MNIIVTGGAGFIGSELIRYLIKETDHQVLNIDKLTYAGNLASLNSISDNKKYSFQKIDVADRANMHKIFGEFQPDIIFHLAAESHVDRSISGPMDFIHTNILGTGVMLDVAQEYWSKSNDIKKNQFRFHHISTDEVYGSLADGELFKENTPYDPSSPYSASKASSDHLVRAWNRTYKLPVILTNCSNNYGPHQFPEKLIPLIILKIMKGEKLPIYGNGLQVRDWLHVEDHVDAIYKVIQKGRIGETYNIGANNQLTNLKVVKMLCDFVDKHEGYPLKGSSSRELISFVEDRPGHDLRYAIDASKIMNEIGWRPRKSFSEGLFETVSWYIDNYRDKL